MLIRKARKVKGRHLSQAKISQLIYRREAGSTVWHFDERCTRWPKRGYIQSKEPKEGTACGECVKRTKGELN